MKPLEILVAFDAYLSEGGLRLEAVVIGGAALNLLGVISRATKDCDILHPELPEVVKLAARAFAATVRRSGMNCAHFCLGLTTKTRTRIGLVTFTQQ